MHNSGLLLEIKKLKAAIKVRGWVQVMLPLSLVAPRAPLAAEVGGKPEKVDVIVTYAQPSGAFTPIWVAHEAGLFQENDRRVRQDRGCADHRRYLRRLCAVPGVEPGGTAGSDPRAIRLLGGEKEFPNAKTPTHETSTITRLSMC